MKVALIDPAHPGMRVVARALRAHRIPAVPLAPGSAGAAPEGVTHVVAPAAALAPPAARPAGAAALAVREGIAPGLWLVEPAGTCPRLTDPDWCVKLAPAAESAERDLWVTVATERWAALTRPANHAPPIEAPRFPRGARPRLVVLEGAAAWLSELVAADMFDIVAVTGSLPDDVDAARVRTVRIEANSPVAGLLRQADAVLCDGSWRLYEAMRLGFRPVACGPVPCGDPRLVHAAAAPADAVDVLQGPADAWRLDYDAWRAFEDFMAVALCREAVADDAAGRAEIVRRLAAPDVPPPPRLARPRRSRMPPIAAACREILGNPRPWLGDLGYAIERRVRRLLSGGRG